MSLKNDTKLTNRNQTEQQANSTQPREKHASKIKKNSPLGPFSSSVALLISFRSGGRGCGRRDWLGSRGERGDRMGQTVVGSSVIGGRMKLRNEGALFGYFAMDVHTIVVSDEEGVSGLQLQDVSVRV